MKKIIVLTLAAIAMSFTFSACNKKVEVENNVTATQVASDSSKAKEEADVKAAAADAEKKAETTNNEAAQEDEELTRKTSPKGLTLTIPPLPDNNFEEVGVTGTVHGPYSNRIIYDGMVFIQIERLKKAKEGEAGIEAAIRENHADVQLREMKIEKTDIVKNVSEPVYQVTYTTGENEDTQLHRDYYIVGDEFDFRLHTQCGADFVDDYNKIIDDLAAGLHLQENEAEG